MSVGWTAALKMELKCTLLADCPVQFVISNSTIFIMARSTGFDELGTMNNVNVLSPGNRLYFATNQQLQRKSKLNWSLWDESNLYIKLPLEVETK